MLLRPVGRAVLRQCSRSTPAVAAPAWRSLSDRGSGGSKLVDVRTKDDYLNFPRDKGVLYFTAAWCPPCRRIGPFFAELSEETPSVSFGKVDIDENDDAAKMAGIMSVPTFKFFKGGEEVDTISGADADLLERTVAKLSDS